MIWIALLLTSFLAIGLRRRPRRPHVWVLVTAALTVAAMYLSFGGG